MNANTSTNHSDWQDRVIDDRYRIIDLIARGSMGRVYRATQEHLQRDVAIKVLDSKVGLDLDDDLHSRFLREAATLGRLHHPNTVRIYDFGVVDDHPYIVMEFVKGPTLQKALRKSPLDIGRVLKLADQVASALQEAHQLGLVHRDLKPGNILLTKIQGMGETAKVVDFGLVKQTEVSDVEATSSELILGTPLYMAPEQIQGAELDGRTDIYALGSILYHAITGERLFGPGVSHTALLVHHLNTEPKPFDEHDIQVPPCLEWTVRTCLAKHARDRFASASELRKALWACAVAVESSDWYDLTLRLSHAGEVILPEGIQTNLEHSGISIAHPKLLEAPSVVTRAFKPSRATTWRWVGVGLGVLLVLVALLWVLSVPTPPESTGTTTDPTPAGSADPATVGGTQSTPPGPGDEDTAPSIPTTQGTASPDTPGSDTAEPEAENAPVDEPTKPTPQPKTTAPAPPPKTSSPKTRTDSAKQQTTPADKTTPSKPDDPFAEIPITDIVDPWANDNGSANP